MWILEERRRGSLGYKDYLAKLLDHAAKLGKGESDTEYPDWADNGALDAEHNHAIAVDKAVLESKPDSWVGNPLKERVVKRAIKAAIPADFDRLDELLELVKARHEYS